MKDLEKQAVVWMQKPQRPVQVLVQGCSMPAADDLCPECGWSAAGGGPQPGETADQIEL